MGSSVGVSILVDRCESLTLDVGLLCLFAMLRSVFGLATVGFDFWVWNGLSLFACWWFPGQLGIGAFVFSGLKGCEGWVAAVLMVSQHLLIFF